MVKVSKSTGGWIDKSKLNNGDILKLVTEAEEQEGKKATQLVGKARVKGWNEDAANVAINAPSKNALIEAFGDDTAAWVEKLLTVTVENVVVAGQRGIALYLAPEGFEVGEDENKFIVVRRKVEPVQTVEYPEEPGINPEDIPF